jgi:hypothetical protein
MDRTRTWPAIGRHRTRIWRLLTVSLVVALGLGLSPVAASADTQRSATATGSGTTAIAAQGNAEARARTALTNQAILAGETCDNVSVSSTFVSLISGIYTYRATASGFCVSAPSYTVPRSATRQGGGPSVDAAISEGEGLARAQILAAGGSCVNWSRTAVPVWSAPSGTWYVFNVTVNALCFT